MLISRTTAADSGGWTPLMLALLADSPRSRRLGCVRLLLDAKADPAVVSNLLETPLHLAASIGSLEAVKLLRQKCKTGDLDPITAEMVLKAVKLLKKDTALGIDFLDVWILRSISHEQAQAIADLLNQCEHSLVWPIQTFINIIVLMGKPNGGIRPIALMPMIYRLWTKIRKHQIAIWDINHVGPWDAAIKGSSALRAAVIGALYDEVASLNHEMVATILWDMEKFYDSIDAVLTKAQELDEAGFDAYFALATFEEAGSRKVTNVKELRTFCLDLDCGPSKEYENQNEAMLALRGFCKKLDLPKPLLINSGRGIHVYWFLSEPISMEEWLPVAETLKRLCAEHNLLADPAVTADAARVLRVPRTHNHKTFEKSTTTKKTVGINFKFVIITVSKILF